jgi:hypothetical protein
VKSVLVLALAACGLSICPIELANAERSTCGPRYKALFTDRSVSESGDSLAIGRSAKVKDLKAVKGRVEGVVAVGPGRLGYSQLYVSKGSTPGPGYSVARKSHSSGIPIRLVCDVTNVLTAGGAVSIPVYVVGGRVWSHDRKWSELWISDVQRPTSARCWGGFFTGTKYGTIFVVNQRNLGDCTVDQSGTVSIGTDLFAAPRSELPLSVDEAVHQRQPGEIVIGGTFPWNQTYPAAS